jgi:hypothetical protein
MNEVEDLDFGAGRNGGGMDDRGKDGRDGTCKVGSGRDGY